MISPEKAEVERRLRQNKNDVDDFSDMLGRIEVQTAETNTKVDNLTTEVASLRTDVTGLQTDVTAIRADVSGLQADVSGLQADVSGLQADVSGLRTDVTGLQTDVTAVRTDMSQLDTRVGTLEVKVDTGFDQVNGRFDGLEGRFDGLEGKFDRLERLLVPPVDESEGEDVTHAATLRRLGFLETKVDLHRSRWSGFGDQLQQHKHMFEIHAERLDKHEGRFDHLDSQMTEVLGILRGTGK